MAKILLVEDDKDLCGVIADSLEFEHYIVDRCENGEEALALIRLRDYDLGILDWSLPKITGIEVCRKYRSLGGQMPLIMLTGKAAIEERVSGLDSGADDYITKPFSLDELNARVRALLRRHSADASSDKLCFQDIVLEPNNYIITRGGIELKLIRKEFLILELLMRYRGKVFTLDSIVDRVWNQSAYPAPDVVRTHIMNLRRKIGEQVIETVHSVGYKIPAE
jgi:DNA-binding response OmpR family regulator